jgi:hypothetical protein
MDEGRTWVGGEIIILLRIVGLPTSGHKHFMIFWHRRRSIVCFGRPVSAAPCLLFLDEIDPILGEVETTVVVLAME